MVDKSRLSSIELVYDIPESLTAPISNGQIVGSIIYKIDGEQIGKSDIYASETVEKIGFWDIFIRILKRIACG